MTPTLTTALIAPLSSLVVAGPSSSDTLIATPTVLLSNLPGTPSAQVPGLTGVEFSPGENTNHFDRIYGHPSGPWILTALADLPSSRDEVLIASGSLVIQEGDPAPWTVSENCGTIDTRCSINASGDLAFATNTSGTVDDDYVATRIAGTWGFAAREGELLPGGSGAVLDDTIDSPVILSDGSVGYAADGLDGSATADVDDDAIVLAGAVLLRKGVTVPPGQSGTSTDRTLDNFDLSDFWASDNGAQYLVQGDLSGSTSSDDVVIVNGAVVLQEGFAVPGSGFVEPIDSSGIKAVSMDASGHWFARGDNDGTEQDWVVRDGDLIAATGSRVLFGEPELWSDFALDACFFGHVGNARGDYVIAGMTDNADLSRDAVIVLNGADVVAREGDPVDLDGNGALDDDLYFDGFGEDDLFLTDALELYVVATLRNGAGARVGQGLVRIQLRAEVGERYCDAVPNSLGRSAPLAAYGSPSVAANDLGFVARDLPAFSHVLFMVGTARDFRGSFGGGEGNLCIGGSIARFDGPDEVVQTGSGGLACLQANLSAMPTSGASVAVMPGDRMMFQCWYRDVDANGLQTTNMTNAVDVLFE
ncbi:MAG: hypothetical protein AAGG01_05015 [Planctomycetota bacterium]